MAAHFPAAVLPMLVAVLRFTAVLSAAQCNNKVPGLDKLSRGVDVTILDLVPFDMRTSDGFRSPLIQYSCDQRKTRIYGDVTYSVPDQVWVISEIPTGSLSTRATVMKTSSEVRKSLSVNAGVDVQTAKFGFSASTSYSKAQSTLLKNERKVASMAVSFGARRVDLQHPNQLKLGENAQRDLEKLPASYTAGAKQYEAFIQQFGTHYISEGKFGGVMSMYLETKNAYFEQNTEEKVEVQASATFYSALTVKGGTSVSNAQAESSFTSDTNKQIKYYGGEANLMESSGISKWQPTIAKNPWLFSTTLRRISDLITDASKKAAMDQAISDYIMRRFLVSELNRVLDTLPASVKAQSDVTNLRRQINDMSRKYPLVESEVDALGARVTSTFTTLFLNYNNARTELSAKNVIMKDVSYSCPTGQILRQVVSDHQDYYDDRTWQFRCAYAPRLSLLGNCRWTGNLYDLGTHYWKYECPGNSVLKGWKSQHHDWWDTRVHQLQCCDVIGATSSPSCSWTGYNTVMQHMEVSVTPSKQVIKGVEGYHKDWYDDDIWRFQVCTM